MSKPIYEGKAKKLFTTDDPEIFLLEYKDSFTAFNGEKKATITGKGRLNNAITAIIFDHLAQKNIPSHFVRKIDDICQLVRKVEIVPLEVVIRNIATGSLCKNFGVKEGLVLPRPLLGFYYKDDDLGDPLVTEDHALILGWAKEDELAVIKEQSLKINEILTSFFASLNLKLVDFKLEFGRTKDGEIVLADEISPDTCRFWDMTTGDRLDKDRFRKDLGNVLEAYEEILRRLESVK